VFVSGLCGLVSLPFYPLWWVLTFFSVRTRFSLPVSCLLSVLLVFRIFLATKSLLQFTLKNFDKILQKLYLEIFNQGSVATQLMCGGILSNCFIASCIECASKNFWKSVNIRQRYGQYLVWRFWRQSIDLHVEADGVFCPKMSSTRMCKYRHSVCSLCRFLADR